MKGKTKRNELLSDKIAEALTVKPRADIEEDHVFGTKPKTVSRTDFNSSDSEDDTIISDFRKKNVSLLSEINKKYEGEVVSRKELKSKESDADSVSFDKIDNVENSLDSISDIEEENVDSEESDDGSEDNLDYSIIQNEKSNTESEESDKSGSENEDEEGYDISQLDAPVLENFEHMKKQNVSEEVKKGTSVRNQLLLWEHLLEMRIHMQRCINTSNQLPMFNVFESMKNAENDEFTAESNLAKSNITNVLDKLLKMQQLLFQGFPDTKSICSTNKTDQSNNEVIKKGESDEEIASDTEDEEIPSETEDEGPHGNRIHNYKIKDNSIHIPHKKRKLEEYEQELSNTHKAFKGFRDSTIKKWNEKTRIGSAANIKNTPTNTVLQQISFILSDRNKLIKRTQLKRSEYDIVGYKPSTSNNISNNEEKDIITEFSRDRKDNDEYIPEIFDDSDFYHQLLRELIECKSSDISDPVQLSRQWIALQQMRSKMKRKVDTKATKGRRIKYVVHNPLVNFMGPEKNLSWTDDSKNELYSSLFGKKFENSIGMDNENNFLFTNK